MSDRNNLGQTVTTAVTGEQTENGQAGDRPAGRGGRRPGAGAPLGNANRTTGGLRAWQASRRLPKGCKDQEERLEAKQREWEQRVLQRYGTIEGPHVDLVETAIRHEGRVLLAERYRRTRKRLTTAEKLSISAEIGNASEARDKTLAKLGILDIRPSEAAAADPWAAFDAKAATSESIAATEGTKP